MRGRRKVTGSHLPAFNNILQMPLAEEEIDTMWITSGYEFRKTLRTKQSLVFSMHL